MAVGLVIVGAKNPALSGLASLAPGGDALPVIAAAATIIIHRTYLRQKELRLLLSHFCVYFQIVSLLDLIVVYVIVLLRIILVVVAVGFLAFERFG